jgi:hypothetical protein
MKHMMIIAVLFLAACGVDGEPIKPEPRPEATPKPGFSLTGRAEVGVSKSW